jgi:hypothetical protein
MVKKYTILTLGLLLAGQSAYSMLEPATTSKPKYKDLEDTLKSCFLKKQECLQSISQYAHQAKNYSWKFHGLGSILLSRPLPEIELVLSNSESDIKRFPNIAEVFSSALFDPKRRRKLIACFLKHGANVDAKNYEGETVLHQAALWGETKLTKLLINNGANVNISSTANGYNTKNNWYNNTPLHFAQNPLVAKYLVQHGANMNAINSRGQTPVQAQIKLGNYKTAAAITAFSFMKQAQEQKADFYRSTFIDQ